MAGESELRTAPPAHATGAVEFVLVDELAGDETFRLRPDGDVSALATSLGRLGQLAPVELRPLPGAGSDGPRFQLVSGFRRLAAVRLLARESVLARVHAELSDEDAWALALSDALLHEPFTEEELEALRGRLRASGTAPWAEELVDDAIVRAPQPPEVRERFYDFLQARGGVAPAPAPVEDDVETGERSATAEPSQAEPAREEIIEVTPEELARDLASRLSALNQDLALAWESWRELPEEDRREIVLGARYVARLFPFLAGER